MFFATNLCVFVLYLKPHQFVCLRGRDFVPIGVCALLEWFWREQRYVSMENRIICRREKRKRDKNIVWIIFIKIHLSFCLIIEHGSGPPLDSDGQGHVCCSIEIPGHPLIQSIRFRIFKNQLFYLKKEWYSLFVGHPWVKSIKNK